MNAILIIGIIITLSAQDLFIQAVGILLMGAAIYIIDSRTFKDE